MPTDPDAAYLAFVAKDARFDGQVFVGVTSTGVYCRPICRVRTPKRSHCQFFDTPAQAEAASFRPCMKCRPEIAPRAHEERWTVMDASRTLARQLGVSERHLRRIFQAEHGVSPQQYLQTRRLLLAKTLLTDSHLPVTQVALASGFGSVRRFNAAFVQSYRMSPSRLRGALPASASTEPSALTVRLAYRTPYDWRSLGRFLAQRAIPGIEQVQLTEQGLCIRRSLRGGALAYDGDSAAPALPDGWIEALWDLNRAQLRLRFSDAWQGAAAPLLQCVKRWLDLDASPEAIQSGLHDLPGEPGLRLPGSLDHFELAVRAVLGQQVSVAAARTLSTRLVSALGQPIDTPWPEVNRSFVAPDVLARQDEEALRAFRLTGARARTLMALAQAWPQLAATIQSVLQGRCQLEGFISDMLALPGIGPWTAHYVAMRGLGWPDTFLPGDVALRKAMTQQFAVTTPREIHHHAQRWSPWRSYAVLRLWDSLTARPLAASRPP